MSSIFSTYSTGENRVTASLLAVIKSLSFERMQRLLGALLEQSEFEIVRFENQVAKDGLGVPDAVIHANIRLLFETKLNTNDINKSQVERHLKRLDQATESTKLLLIITPDEVRPAALGPFADDRLVWTSFSRIDQAIDEILEDKYEVTSEREAFVLRELQNMLTAEGLLASDNDVVVVAARNAWPEYNNDQLGAYVCQPNRTFQRVSRIAFYSKGQIYPLVPKIVEVHNEVVFESGRYSGQLGKLVERLIREGRREEGELYKVLLLSAPDSPDTLRLPAPILNNSVAKSGKPIAYTMGQRYANSERLLHAKTTSDLA